ncbi:MAG TPA: response regulator transcription factor [Gaiellaceae bacterium]|jgi:DNA-binding response OmpR family regulator
MQNLLLVEPEPETREYLARNLADDGYAVLGTGRNGEALDLAERARPHLVLAAELDLCRRLRQGEPGRRWDRNVPVIVLAPAESDPVARVRAFERGADDVIERPIVYLELLARIRALLRRAVPGSAEVLEAEAVVVDRRTRLVHVRGTPVQLAGKEFELAATLASEPRRVFTKDELLRDVWGFRSAGRTRTLDSHASRLRRKLSLADGDRFVVNVWGVGYRLLD